MSPEELRSLQEALKNSPDNTPLRKYLADQLLKAGKYQEAELEYKEALRLSPNDLEIKIGLGNSFLEQQKTSAGLVLLEDLIDNNAQLPAKAYLIHARLLLQNKQADEAMAAYEKALIINKDMADPFLATQIKEQQAEEGKNDPRKIKLTTGSEEEFDFEGVEMERPKITFADVGGLEKIKEEIRMKIIHPLKHPEIYKAYGKAIGGGILLYGPPGCGKTHLAKATAGEISANFISVGINDILNLYIGESERNLHAIFEQARNSSPCVLFFDEVDALGASRNDMKQSAGRQLINQFLAEMDGVEYSNDGVLILAATNAPWHLDTAFRRPGRFDRIIFVSPPDEAAREEIIEAMLKDKPKEAIDNRQVAKKTAEFSGADLKAVVDIAIESKLEEAMRSGGAIPLSLKDLIKASKQHRPTTKEWFSKAKNYALFANEAGLYDDILKYMKIKK